MIFLNFPVHARVLTNKPVFVNWKYSWVSNMNLESVDQPGIDLVAGAKRHYKSTDLAYMCNQFVQEKYHNFYQIFTDAMVQKMNMEWVQPSTMSRTAPILVSESHRKY